MAETISRIKFFGVNDMSTGYYLTKAESKLSLMDLKAPLVDINEALELLNIVQMFRTDVRLKKWSDKQYFDLKSKALSANSLIGRFINTICDANIEEELRNTDHALVQDFWLAFSLFKVYKSVSGATFSRILLDEPYHIYSILKYKNIVESFSEQIVSFLMSFERSAELLITEYLSYREFNSSSLYFPKELTLELKEAIIEKYINLPEPNPNFIKLIFEARDNTNLKLSTRIKHMAQKLYDSFSRDYFSSHPDSGNVLTCNVSFAPDSEEPIVKFESINLKTEVIFGKLWVEKNSDYPTLWNNFIYMLHFVDSQTRCDFVSKPRKHSVLENLSGGRGKTTYFQDTSEKFKNRMFICFLEAYRNELTELNIALEDLVSWFFYDYLPNEFRVSDFHFNAPSKATTYLEKCKILATEIDGLLKQFNTYVINGKIDRGLFEFDTDSIKTHDIASMIPKKYFYAASEKCIHCMNLLFSNQTSLSFTQSGHDDYETFYALLNNQNVSISDFHDFNTPLIEFLITENCVTRNDNNTLCLNNHKVQVLQDLYDNQVCCTSYYLDLEDLLQNLSDNGEIRFTSTFLTEPEQDYFSYILTQSIFSNGLDLRNKYVHGSYPLEISLHENDYMELFKLLIVIIIKINEEFCLRDDLANLTTNQV